MKEAWFSRISLSCITLLVLLAGQNLRAQNSSIALEVTGIDPAAHKILPPDQNLFLRVHYQSPQNFRLQAAGRLQGKEIRDLTNASPTYPAGEGDGLVWIAFRHPTKIDEIVVTASDSNWRPLQTLVVPMPMEWATQAPDPVRASWVGEMSEEQQRQISVAMKQSTEEPPGSDFFAWIIFPLMVLGVPGYIVLQIISLRREGFLSLAALPLPVMIPVLIFTTYALAQESNLWPLYLLFCSPVAFVYLAALLLLRSGKS